MSDAMDTLDLTNGVSASSVRRTAAESFNKLRTTFGRPSHDGAPAAAANSNTSTAQAAARKKTGVPAASVLSINVEIAGTVVAPDELHVFGTIEGNVRAQSLTVCPGGMIRGEVVADVITVQGAIEGRVHGATVQIAAGGSVRGDIIHAALGIDQAGIFEGASRRVQNPMADAPVIVAIQRQAAE
jgi:cytoskeletal protein CcmA (bactofilin family)